MHTIIRGGYTSHLTPLKLKIVVHTPYLILVPWKYFRKKSNQRGFKQCLISDGLSGVLVMTSWAPRNYSGVKVLPLPQPHLRTRTYAQTYPSTQRATQLRGVLARVYSVTIQNLNTVSNTTVP
jgi:hypothetical protein